ncbi:SAM-dependent methyltransferase [Natrinema salinisoli]|uniref:SAM-dependent methyltransferase n=1 Tax=Natrinema salinisoli TaxID=2878535 RepID=UPI001CEFD356|nr:class I SAM-dependent methyltransferase [Natrinema salinisoli]
MHTRRFDTDEIVAFYNDTAWEYRVLWSDSNLHYGFYDDDSTSHQRAMENSNSVYADKLEVDETATVLDIGTGRGGFPTRVAAEYGAEVHGIDIVPHLAHVSEFRAMLEDLGFANVTFEDHYERIIPSSRRQRWLSRAVTPLLRIASATGLKNDSSVEQGVTLYYQYEIIERGIAVHGDFTADLPE